MIVSAFLTIVSSLLSPLFSALPVASLPTGVLDGISYVGTAVAYVDQFFPIAGPLQFAVTVLGFLAPLLAFRGGIFVWKLIRG